MPKKKRHPIQTITLDRYPHYLEHRFIEGNIVTLNKGKGHETRVLKNLIRKHRKIWKYINKEKGIYKKERFHKNTKKEIWREYRLITENNGVVIGRSPVFGLPIRSIANVCYLVGGSGFSGLDYEYSVCFVGLEWNDRQKIYNKICLIWTLWSGAIKEVK
ncbi:hypothetical protein LCGC14_0404020 [marine sediment metagenome]|uniref:Uncharacterized protein n=1 Tax=marine sediment metagenome TaxID=412755 RepID=A0A0F9W4W7_9ZZZZ